jgi:hypothetical protein
MGGHANADDVATMVQEATMMPLMNLFMKILLVFEYGRLIGSWRRDRLA